MKALRVFTNSDLRGAYGFSFSGTMFVEVPVEGHEPQLVPVPVASTGPFRSEGNGNIPEGSRTLNISGTVLEQTFTYAYQGEPDGRGKADCPLLETWDDGILQFVINSQNREIQSVGTNRYTASSMK